MEDAAEGFSVVASGGLPQVEEGGGERVGNSVIFAAAPVVGIWVLTAGEEVGVWTAVVLAWDEA